MLSVQKRGGQECRALAQTLAAAECGKLGSGKNVLNEAAQSAQFSRSVVSDTLQPLGLQHAGPPCSSPAPEACSNSCPLSRRCHPTISSSVVPFSSCLQSFLASWYSPMSWLFASGGQSIGVSALASVLPMNIQDRFPLGWTGWNSNILTLLLKQTLENREE